MPFPSCFQRHRFLAAVALATATVSLARGTRELPPPPSAALVPLEALPLRTRGASVVGADGRLVRLACVNWYGAHMQQMVNNGLDKQPLEALAATIVRLKFNCVRLPFSLELVLTNRSRIPEEAAALAANPSLQGLSPMELFDATVAALTVAGLLVILNNHISRAGWCCDPFDGEGLWYTTEYPEAVWLSVLGSMAARYRHDARVVGFDLRNELRSSHMGFPTWGTGDVATDWAAAALRGSQSVLAGDPELLIIVSALHFPMLLCDVPARPLHLSEPTLRDRTIYTPHEYFWWSFHLVVSDAIRRYYLRLLMVASAYMALATFSFFLGRGTPWESIYWPPCCFTFAVLSIWALVFCITLGRFFSARCAAHGLVPALLYLWGPKAIALLSWVLWMATFVVSLLHAARRTCESPKPLTPEANGMVEIENLGYQYIDAESSRTNHRSVWCGRFGLVAAVCCPLLALEEARITCGSYEAFAGDVDRRWGFLANSAGEHHNETAPIWLGEFGTAGAGNRSAGIAGIWWQYMLRYLGEHDINWAYWPLNGVKSRGRLDSYGLLEEDYVTVREPRKLAALQRLAAGANPA